MNTLEFCYECASEFGGLGCLSRLMMAKTAPSDDDKWYHLSIYENQIAHCPLLTKKEKKEVNRDFVREVVMGAMEWLKLAKRAIEEKNNETLALFNINNALALLKKAEDLLFH